MPLLAELHAANVAAIRPPGLGLVQVPGGPISLDSLGKIAQTVGVLIAGLGLLFSAEVRRRDLRWRKASQSQTLLDQLHSHPLAGEAVHMMDCALAGFEYECYAPNAPEEVLSLPQALAGLSAGKEATAAQKHIYSCFDWFLYYTDRIAYLVQSVHLANLEDVAAPFKPYAGLLLADEQWSRIEPLVTAHNYKYIRGFLERVRDTP